MLLESRHSAGPGCSVVLRHVICIGPHDLAEDGYLPSFCTACYRLGRTGHDFMEFAKPGDIQQYCTPNALLTFQEYLIDYASPETRAVGEGLVDELLGEATPSLRETVEQRLERIRAGERDLYL